MINRFFTIIIVVLATGGRSIAYNIGSIGNYQVEALLTNQARNEWGVDLLQSFAENVAESKWTGLPAPLFPALIGDKGNTPQTQFSSWCIGHIATARTQERFGVVLEELRRNQDANSSRVLTLRLHACITDEEMTPELRLSALSAIVNNDRDLVIDSLLVFCLHYVNEIETLRHLQLRNSDVTSANNDASQTLSALTADVLDTLKSVERTEVVAEYIDVFISAAMHPDSPLGIEKISLRNFFPPFVLAHGDPARVFHISIDRSVPNASRVESSKLTVSERGLLNSYRSEILPGTNFIAATVGRHELFRFVDQMLTRIAIDEKKHPQLYAGKETELDLLVARLLQIDDISIVFLIAPRLQAEVNTIIDKSRNSEPGGVRSKLAHAILRLLQSISAEPKIKFGVSAVDCYDALNELRESGTTVERSLLAKMRSKVPESE